MIEGNWEKLMELYLGKPHLIQKIIKSKLKELCSYRKQIGKI
jgi:hypothetical protein